MFLKFSAISENITIDLPTSKDNLSAGKGLVKCIGTTWELKASNCPNSVSSASTNKASFPIFFILVKKLVLSPCWA